MKKFALFAMLICAGLISFGCSNEKPKDNKPDAKTEKKEGTEEKAPVEKTEKPDEKPAEK
jgi:hypothetical protein